MYKETPTDPAREYGKFHIGVTGISATIKKGLAVTVEDAAAGTPAAGKFTKGDVLVAVNGHPVAEPEPWVALGRALGAAEAGDGRLTFTVKRDAQETQVTIVIPVLGAYSQTWPLKCAKSARIIRQTADHIMLKSAKLTMGLTDCLEGLFLLSTGDGQYLPAVQAMVHHSPTNCGSHTWGNGYAGVLLGEYYLRTGDAAALPRLKAICDDSARRQYYGGWSHGGDGTGGGYVCGGLMNPAGAQILTTLILAKESGVEVNPDTFQQALRFFYRFVGHTGVPYGDHRPEMWLSCNGKNGMIACALSLVDNPACQMAARHYGLDVTDSYRWLLGGHTGGGFDVIWRGLGSVHVPPDKQDHYRRSLDNLAWYYDLCRLPHGGFDMVGGGMYAGENWGTGGMGLAYTAPLRTLRITGAPPTKYSKRVVLARSPWGNARDLAFLSNEYGPGFGKEDLAPDEVYQLLGDQYTRPTGLGATNSAFCVRMMQHYNPVARTQAALTLARLGATNELARALADPDPRVRRAACDGIDLYGAWNHFATGAFPPAVVTAVFLPGLEKIINDPAAAWWELDGALLALSRATPAGIMRNIKTIRRFLDHEEWFLREGAALCLVSLAQDEKLFHDQEPFLMDYLATERHLFPRRAVLSLLRKYQTSKEISTGAVQDIIAGLMGATTRMELVPGHLSGMTVNNRYEMMRFFYAQAPELSGKIIDEAETMLAAPGGLEGCNIQWYFTGEGWGNPGVLKSLDKLPVAQRAPLLARCKQFVAKLETEQARLKTAGKDTKKIERVIADINKALADYEKGPVAPQRK